MSFLSSVRQIFSQDRSKKQPIAFQERKARGEFALALDIGTEWIKTVVFSTKNFAQKEAKILGISHVKQEYGDMNGGAIVNIGRVAEKCTQAIEEAMVMSNTEPEQMIVGIGGELVKGASTTIQYERPHPHVPINLHELKEIVHRVQWKAFDRVRAQLSEETGYPEVDVKLINAAITEVTIDSFPVANPLGFQGKYLTVTIFNAFAPLIHFSSLKTIADQLSFDLLAITAEPYSIAKALNDTTNNTWDGIIIDIGGGTSDIAVVRNGVLEGTKMFALGGQSVTKRIEQLFNLSYKEAEALKLNMLKNKLPREKMTLLQKTLLQDAKVWRSGVELTLQEMSMGEPLPNNIYLCGGGSLLPQIPIVLEEETWFNNLPFRAKPSIMQVRCKDIGTFHDETGELQDPQDVTVLGLAHLALELAGEERLIDRILRKTLQMMRN